MRVLLKKKGKLVLVDMEDDLYEYLKHKRSSGTFASDPEIRKTGIVSFVKLPKNRPKTLPKRVRSYGFGEKDYFSNAWWGSDKKRKFGGVWDFSHLLPEEELAARKKAKAKLSEKKFGKRKFSRKKSRFSKKRRSKKRSSK